MKRSNLFPWLNTVAFVGVIIVNALANALPINGLNTGEVSDLYPSLFTPAGITFSIWSVIYLLLAGFVIYQWKIRNENYFLTLSKWFITSCLLNVTWILVWHNLLPAASVVVMLLFLFVLVRIFLLLQPQKSTTTGEYIFVRLPFTLYLSWICVATIANISAWLVSLSWNGGPISETIWTIAMMCVATMLGIFILAKYRNYAFPLVTVWALIGIAWKGLPEITPAAMFLTAILFLAEIIIAVRAKHNTRTN
jgi:translocator protein